MEGSEAIANAAIAAGCRFFAGYPMTPFTELLEHFAKRLPERGGVCINAESELEAVGMAWGALATGARAATGSTGQGLSLMQESFSEITLAELPLVIFNMARGGQDYFQSTRGGGHGDYRHIVLAPMDIAEAVELTQLAFHLADTWRNPVLVYGDYLLAHIAGAVDVAPIDFGELRRRTGRSTARSAGRGHSRIVSPLGFGKAGQREPGHRASLACASRRSTPRWRRPRHGSRPASSTMRRRSSSRSASPAKFVRYVVRQLRAEGEKIGLRTTDHAVAVPLRRRRGRRRPGPQRSAVFELCAGQMIDDVRLGVLGRAPVVPIGGISTDGSGFGVGPLLDAELIRARVLAVHRGGAEAELPPLPDNERDQEITMSTTSPLLGPVLDTSVLPEHAKQVAGLKPDLLLTQEHHMCPGCGEPLALRGYLEAIEELAAQRNDRSWSPASAATRASPTTVDLDLVQALHGRAPSVATGDQAHVARRDRVHPAGRRRHGQRRPAGGAAHRRPRRERHVHPAQQRRVRRDRRPHDGHDACSGQRTKNSLDGRDAEYHGYPILIGDLIAQLQGATYVARGSVHNAGAVARTKKMFRRAFETQLAGRRVHVRRGADDVPDGMVHPDGGRPRVHDVDTR